MRRVGPDAAAHPSFYQPSVDRIPEGNLSHRSFQKAVRRAGSSGTSTTLSFAQRMRKHSASAAWAIFEAHAKSSSTSAPTPAPPRIPEGRSV